MEKSSRDQVLRKIHQHNTHIQPSFFSTQQQFLLKHESLFINNKPISGQFSFLSRDQILYYTSSMLVIKSLEKNTSRFLQKEGKLNNVTAICASMLEAQDQSIIAVGDTVEEKAAITIVTVSDEREEWKSFPTGVKGEVEFLEFNKERTRLGSLVNVGDQIVVSVWNVEKRTLLITHSLRSLDIKRFTLNMNTDKNLYLYGDGILKMYEFNSHEKCLKELGINLLAREHKESKFIDHMWIFQAYQQHLLILISNTKVFVVKNDTILRSVFVDIERTKIKSWNCLKLDKDLDQEREMTYLDQVRLTQKFELKCLMREGRVRKNNDMSLVMGASNGLLLFFDLNNSHFSTYQVLYNEEMISISCNSARTLIASVTKDYYEQNFSFNYVKMELLDSEEIPVRRLFGEGAHRGGILGLSVSRAREIVATISLDRSLRIWNYSTKESMIASYFKECPTSLSLHPSGFYLAVSFNTHIDMYCVLTRSLHLLKSIKKLDNCKSILFSNKGHFLVTNQLSCIKIYDPNTLRPLSMHELEDGLVNVAQLALSRDDTKLAVNFSNGHVYCWDLVECQSSPASKPAHIEVLCYKHMVIDNDNDLFVGTNDKKHLVLYKGDCQTLITEFPGGELVVESMVLSKELGVLFVGTSSGSVRMYPWPMNESNLEYSAMKGEGNRVRMKLPAYYETKLHEKSITFLDISEDSRFLFVGMDNGGVMMLEIKGLKTEEERNHKDKEHFMELKEERRRIKDIGTKLFLFCDPKIQAKNQELGIIEDEVQKLEEMVDRSKFMREKNLNRILDEKTDNYTSLISKERQLQERTLKAQGQEIKELEEDFKIASKDVQDKFTWNKRENERIKEYELQRKQEVVDGIHLLKREHIQRLGDLLQTHKQQICLAKDKYRQMNEEIQKEYHQVIKEAQSISPQSNDLVLPDEVQAQPSRQNILRLNTLIEQLKLTEKALKEENTRDREAEEKEQVLFNETLGKYNSCRLKSIRVREEIIKMEHQVNERIKIIRGKETDYKDAVECQLNLENYKFVIDNRITELQNRKQGVVEGIKDKEGELEILFNELMASTRTNENKQLEVAKMEHAMKSLENSTHKSEIQIFFGIKRLGAYQRFLQQMISGELSEEETYKKVHEFLSEPLHEDLQMIGFLDKELITPEDMREIQKLKEQKCNQENELLLTEAKAISKKFNLMKFNCKKMKDTHEANITNTLKQNQKLVEECNLLRYQDQCYQNEIKKVRRYINKTIEDQKRLIATKKNQERMLKFEKKLKENELSLKEQAIKLTDLKEFMSIIKESPA